MVLEIHMKLCMTEPDFPENFFLPPKLGKWVKYELETGYFFNILKNVVINFY